jgi:hypothetical protein
MSDTSAKPFLVVVFLFGFVLGALVGPGLGSLRDASLSSENGESDPDASPTSIPSGGSGRYDEAGLNENSGWVHVMANGETYAVTLDASVVHPPGTALATNVSFRPVRNVRGGDPDDSGRAGREGRSRLQAPH